MATHWEVLESMKYPDIQEVQFLVLQAKQLANMELHILHVLVSGDK